MIIKNAFLLLFFFLEKKIKNNISSIYLYKTHFVFESKLYLYMHYSEFNNYNYPLSKIIE